MTRFYSVFSGDSSFHVIDSTRKNQFGERYCVAPYLSRESADNLAEWLNADSAHIGQFEHGQCPFGVS